MRLTATRAARRCSCSLYCSPDWLALYSKACSTAAAMKDSVACPLGQLACPETRIMVWICGDSSDALACTGVLDAHADIHGQRHRQGDDFQRVFVAVRLQINNRCKKKQARGGLGQHFTAARVCPAAQEHQSAARL